MLVLLSGAVVLPGPFCKRDSRSQQGFLSGKVEVIVIIINTLARTYNVIRLP